MVAPTGRPFFFVSLMPNHDLLHFPFPVLVGYHKIDSFRNSFSIPIPDMPQLHHFLPLHI